MQTSHLVIIKHNRKSSDNKTYGGQRNVGELDGPQEGGIWAACGLHAARMPTIGLAWILGY